MKITLLKGALVALALACAVLVGAVAWEVSGEALPEVSAIAEANPGEVERGAYLARAGNCMACHTARGGQAYAGGRAINTPFGTVYSSNLTPDADTGLGGWSAAAFRRALHEGRSRDGRLLYPVFPYTHTTLVTDEDSDALYAYLRSLPPATNATPENTLRFPVNSQAALAVWRLLYFESARFAPQPERSAEWNRGAYLASGLAHCSACHSERDALGGSVFSQRWGAGLMPDGHWLAPSLRDAAQAGVADWSVAQVTAFLKDGCNDTATAMGPMAEVVFDGTQHLRSEDVQAMAVFLKDLPGSAQPAVVADRAFERAKPEVMALGEKLYGQQCVDCHGASGQGALGAYPALAGNRSVVMGPHVNAVQAILAGGFSPATAGNPQPYGMPPFRTLLSDAEVAAVASFVRQSWGNQANPVLPQEVQRLR